MNMGGMSGQSTSASSHMSMASSTTSSMGSMSTGMSGMSGMSEMTMHQYFTTDWKNYPVIFEGMRAHNGGQAFGIFLVLMFAGILVKGLDFLRNYLEQVVWRNPAYFGPEDSESSYRYPRRRVSSKDLNLDEKMKSNANNKLDSNSSLSKDFGVEQTPSFGKLWVSRIVRDCIRLVLCILPELLSYALMLAAMSFSVLYFFAIILGLGIGRFVSEKLQYKLNIRPMSSTYYHC